jgi:hypothetical protein
MKLAWTAGLLAAIGAAIGCGSVNGIDVGAGSGGAGAAGTTTGTGTTSTGTGTIGADSGLPCDVAMMLSTYCITCHSNPPLPPAPMPMLTYDDLAAPAVTNPNETVAQMAVQRMADAAKPMPPAGLPAVPAATQASFAAWVSGGLMKGNCGGIDAGPPDTTFTGPSVCASMQTLPLVTDDGDGAMDPGMACITCHDKGEGPHFAIGGTVFATGHVPDRCKPTGTQSTDLSQATVVITDANGTDHTLPVDSVGNFHSGDHNGGGSIPFPYHAKVVYMGKERPMLMAQSNGDCNSCHTDAGLNGAPGRVALPQ